MANKDLGVWDFLKSILQMDSVFSPPWLSRMYISPSEKIIRDGTEYVTLKDIVAAPGDLGSVFSVVQITV